MDWNLRLNKHIDMAKDFAAQNDYVLLGVFLIGSQNYGLETPSSDVDSLAICIPRLSVLAHTGPRDSMLSTRVPLTGTNEFVTLKDIRVYNYELRNMRLSCLETLVTDYKWINPILKEVWNLYEKNADSIIHYAPFKMRMALMGLFFSYRKAFLYGNANAKEPLSSVGYDIKSFVHMIWLGDVMSNWINDTLPFKDIIKVKVSSESIISQVRALNYSYSAMSIKLQELTDGMNEACDDITDVWSGADVKVVDVMNDILTLAFYTVYNKFDL